MKTNKSKNKLSLNKLQIAKINHLHFIKGGDMHVIDISEDDERSYRPDCPSENCPPSNNLCH